ncbi:MAG: hypothetical protein GWP61_00205 [Chloroflexi bacterium]|nr:hypothetical protein [Chloroflexota bacterium]
MPMKKRRLSHLPPTAVPITSNDLLAGLRSSKETLEQFRIALASYFGISGDACRLASSGRTALYCLFQGLKARRPARTQVVMPAYTCPAVARVVVDLELQPIFVDLVPETMCYEPDGLEAVVGEQTLAVVLVHPFGIPLAVGETIALAHEADAVVIEDAAQAMGARWDGQPVGTRGDFGLFSLGPGKPISTGGGGITVANDAQATAVLDSGWTHLPEPSNLVSVTAWMRQAAFQLAFQPRGFWAATKMGLHRVGNHESSWGYTVQGLTAMQAGVGLALLPRLDAINAQRRRKARKLQEALGRSPNLRSIFVAEKAEPIFLRYPLLAASEEERESLYEALWAAGMGVGRLYEKSLPAIYKPGTQASFPGAETIARRLLTLPTHHNVTGDDIINVKVVASA